MHLRSYRSHEAVESYIFKWCTIKTNPSSWINSLFKFGNNDVKAEFFWGFEAEVSHGWAKFLHDVIISFFIWTALEFKNFQESDSSWQIVISSAGIKDRLNGENYISVLERYNSDNLLGKFLVMGSYRPWGVHGGPFECTSNRRDQSQSIQPMRLPIGLGSKLGQSQI